MIPKEKIEEVKDRASIVQVISEYVPLTKRGANHIGLCPFHSEKTPSFTVSEEKKIFHCFGCNATGNVITFVMKKDGLEFPEAVRSIARRCGITIEEEKKGATDFRDSLYKALKISVEYFEHGLKGPEGKSAAEYLKKRGFEGEMVSRFHLGFAPERWEGLAGYLKRKGVSMDVAEKAGLVVKKENGHYDRFRGRLIFPITDSKGRVVGFGGRELDGKGPKYLNSPESPVFKKGETLYGFFQAKQNISKAGAAIVVEGYFDLLALHKYGFTNSVATMGTALTPEHLRALKGYAGAVYVLFDADQAGKNAAIRGLTLFLNEEITCRAVTLSQGKDPDEFLAMNGAEAMKKAIEAAPPLMEFYLKELQKKVDLSTPEGKRKYLNGALDYLLKVKNVAERGHYAGIVASTLGIPPESVYEALKIPEKPAQQGSARKDVLDARNSRLKELTILKVILKHPELYDDKVESAIGAFTDPALKKIGSVASQFLKQGRSLDASAIMEEMGEGDIKASVAELFLKEDDGFVEDPRRMLEDSLKRVLSRGKIKDTTMEMIKRLEDTGRSEVASLIKKRIEKGS